MKGHRCVECNTITKYESEERFLNLAMVGNDEWVIHKKFVCPNCGWYYFDLFTEEIPDTEKKVFMR
jgi:predicted  nucleic acid-binding Zn-ribbon protein